MSEFETLHNACPEPENTIDFSRAVRLGGSGGSCDCFKTRLHRRTVFVKRLKPELRHHPRYVGAFDKEYDLGVDLSHPALPEYREFHDDYIVMDYIDGKTLACLIAENDPWLKNDANIRKLLESLVDVVDYLHQRDVVHCDIKADNVMVSNGNRNLKLIDLGNAYSDWFTDTSGNPGNYELSADDLGNPEMDFRGIGRIADCLIDGGFGKSGFLSHFRKLCFRPGVTADMLRDALTKDGSRTRGRLVRHAVMIAAAITLCICGVIIYRHNMSGEQVTTQAVADTVGAKPLPENVAQPQSPAPSAHEVQATQQNVKAVPEVPAAATAPAPTPTATSSPAYKEIINAEMKGMVKPMLGQLDRAEALAGDAGASVSALRDALYDLGNSYSSTAEKSYALFKKRFPDVSAATIELAVADSPAFQEMLQGYSTVSQKITDRIFEIQDK